MSENSDLVIECDVYSRIVGYFSPTRTWNIGKRQEFRDRKMFNPDSEGSDNNGDVSKSDGDGDLA